MRRLALILSVALVALNGCGGPITDEELDRGIQTLAAAASEGRLVALDVAANRTKTTFVRVEMRDLGGDAEHEAEKLNDAQAQPGNTQIKAHAVKLAQDISSAMGDLQVSPSDRRLARQIALRLDALSKQADSLSARL